MSTMNGLKKDLETIKELLKEGESKFPILEKKERNHHEEYDSFIIFDKISFVAKRIANSIQYLEHKED